MATVAERDYQKSLIRKIRDLFPDCVVLKNDTDYQQGIPDLLVLFEDRWAMLEVKASDEAPIQMNQEYFVQRFNEMSFAAFVYPENEEKVLYELQRAFESSGLTRVSQC
jgi:hypothetical protein